MWLGLGIVSTCCAAALGVSGPAHAAPGVDVSGEYSVSDLGETTCGPVGLSPFLFRCDTTGLVSRYSGDLEGAAVADFTSLVDCATGRETGHGTETFVGSIRGAGVGTLTWIDQFSANVDCSSFFPFDLDIRSVAVKGSAGFEGLQGKLEFTDTTYSGSLH